MTNIDVKNLLLHSSTELALSDRRLYNYLLHNAFNGLSKQLDFKISLTELEGVYGISLPPIDRLKESLRRLMRTLIEFETPSGEWIITNLLARAELDKLQGKLYYSYPLDCRQLFTHSLTLEKCLIQAHFTQKYSNLLYEILSEAHFSKQTQISLEIADLRSRLHIPDNKLSNYNDLDRFVLTPAIKEINSYASFAVKFHTARKGMKVINVIFEMATKKNLFNIENASQIIPQKRPRLFIDNPALENAYAYLLNAETKERRKFFEIAIKNAAKEKKIISEEEFDRPDLWFKWVESKILKINLK
jgi:hypothetical protein